MPNKKWYVYMVRCCDNSLYCGVAIDVCKRVFEHNYSAKGARYTRSRRNVMLVFKEGPFSRSEALSRESRVKKMRKSAKEKLVEAWHMENPGVSSF